MSLAVLFSVQAPDAKAGEPAKLLLSGTRIPRDTFRVLKQADEMLRAAEAAAAQLRAQSVATIAAQRQRAHEQGFAQGRAEGLVAVLGTLEAERRLRELLSHRLADVVERCLRSLIGEWGEPQLMRERVLHLVKTSALEPGAASTAASATLHVGPADWAAAQAAVAELGRETAGVMGSLQLVVDPGQSPGELLLETQVGFVHSSLQLTLDQARELLQKALAKAVQTLGEPLP